MYPTQDNNQKIVRVTIKSNYVEEAPCFNWFNVQLLYRNNQSIVDISLFLQQYIFHGNLTNYISSSLTVMAKILKLMCFAPDNTEIQERNTKTNEVLFYL